MPLPRARALSARPAARPPLLRARHVPIAGTSFGAYDGTKLAKTHGVVIVAANYRLDALGWMALQVGHAC